MIEEKVFRYLQGWWIPYGARGLILDHDERYAISGNAPIIVDKQSCNMYSTGTASPQLFIDDFKLYKQQKHTKYKWQNHVINLQYLG